MSVLKAMEHSSEALRNLVGVAGLSVREATQEIVVIVPSSVMMGMMYEVRHQQLSPTTAGIKFAGITYITKEDYDERYNGRS